MVTNASRLLVAALVVICALGLSDNAYGLVTRTIKGRVIDSETGMPVEGAIALCVWTKPQWGVEVTHPVTKVGESLSDHEGRITINGNWGLFLDPPELIIYKRSYRAWNNQEIFPSHDSRTDFTWAEGFVIRLERWKEGDTFNDHEEFVATHSLGARTRAFAEAMDWERLEQVKENDRINERRRSLK